MNKTIIDNLKERKDNVPFKVGGEGTAFMFENYILKKYHPFHYWNMRAFEGYFKELQKFSTEGCNIPNVVDWKSFGKDECYLLQEKLSTKEIYPTGSKVNLTINDKIETIDVSPLNFIYAECEGFCSREEFLNAIDKADPNDPLYALIVMTYLKIFLNTSKKLEGVNVNVLDEFILNDTYMTCYGEYGVPDIHAGNVFIDRNANDLKEIQIIDNFFLNGFENECLNNEGLTGNSIYADMFKLFKLNGELKSLLVGFSGKTLKEMEQVVNENLKLCENALLKFVKRSKTIIRPQKKLSKKEDYVCRQVAGSISGKNGKIMQEIESQFEM